MKQLGTTIFHLDRELARDEPTLERALKRIPFGSLLLLTENGPDQAEQSPGSSYQFTPIPSLKEGRPGQSIDAFGKLRIDNEIIDIVSKRADPLEVLDGEGKIETVLALEYSIAQQLSDSQAPALDYLGFEKRRRDFLIITQFENSVVSCDHLLKQTTTKKMLTRAMSVAATTLISLHTRGIVHDDFMLQSTAFDTQAKTARTIDLNFSHRPPEDKKIQKFIKNIKDYTISLDNWYCDRPKGSTYPIPTTDLIDEHFLKPYTQGMGKQGPTPEEMAHILNTLHRFYD